MVSWPSVEHHMITSHPLECQPRDMWDAVRAGVAHPGLQNQEYYIVSYYFNLQQSIIPSFANIEMIQINGFYIDAIYQLHIMPSYYSYCKKFSINCWDKTFLEEKIIFYLFFLSIGQLQTKFISFNSYMWILFVREVFIFNLYST